MIKEKFDVVSGTSLLSVVENKEETLTKLISLLKDKKSTLIIIEPTNLMTKESVKAIMLDLKTIWFYKGLLLWASAREGKETPRTLFKNLENVKLTHHYHLKKMVRVTYIRLL